MIWDKDISYFGFFFYFLEGYIVDFVVFFTVIKCVIVLGFGSFKFLICGERGEGKGWVFF